MYPTSLFKRVDYLQLDHSRFTLLGVVPEIMPEFTTIYTNSLLLFKKKLVKMQVAYYYLVGYLAM